MIVNVGIENVLNSLIGSEFDIEFYDQSGALNNIEKTRGNIGRYKSGASIFLTRTFLETSWLRLGKHKTFLEAYDEAKNNSISNFTELFDIENTRFIHSTDNLSDKISSTDYMNITLKQLTEEKYWDVWNGDTSNTYLNWKSYPEVPSSQSFGFAVRELLESVEKYYLIQFNSNKKIKLTNDGLKDASTNQIIELTGELLASGGWYKGETIIELEGEPMNLTTAIATVDWNTQKITYKSGKASQISFDKLSYENANLKSFIDYSIRTTEPIHDFLIGENWIIEPK
ncbi:hypothetical protein PQE68_gp123 [Bacillus phage vB_BanS_Sophrita]|uniref:Uncharacterized protein n=1 Tax=Bacillus phage vB_BanS_Sophrita TaxID=2894790 RepID=A0AAE9CDU9_9CAUD|nr:hypothetical protein PQE68_gp123 [Bacillus phage vB_BanS_Sophrita]UGO50714.1 hypothetical protein SOPHRITA_123 [Bacillus phage vB_BanS_Sophrita]